MNARRHRIRIPTAYQDMTLWPKPDTSAWERRAQDSFDKKRQALVLYGEGASLDQITTETGIQRNEVHRLIRRCLALASDGQIFGYRALVPRTRVKGYNRRAEVDHVKGSGSGGCAGALSKLFDRFPEIEELVVDLFCKQGAKETMNESRISISSIHDQFKCKLRELGFTDSDWPFSTSNCGYKTLFKYCQTLRLTKRHETTGARAGVEAALRDPVGNGNRSIFPKLRPYGAVQLDFHKVDAASVILITNDYGKVMEVPLSRWHFGLLVEEFSRAILGYAVVLELTPSADSTLEIVSNALSSCQPEFIPAFSSDNGSFVINQLMPELQYQAFAALKVDNAWSNAAHEVVNNIIDTIGCAVNFGPVRAWFRRDLIEKILGELTRRGLQRLPSTHGSGPKDTRIDHPNEQAAKFRITLRDLVDIFQRCIQEQNISDTEGRQFSAPVQVLQNALAKPASGFFRQPLPKTVQAHAKLMMHIEEATVRGNIEKGVRPYFTLSRHRHTNEMLANSFHLIGKKLVVYLDRRLARVVYATVKDTGQDLGQMRLSGPWAKSNCSWRDRKLMINSGLALRYGSVGGDPLDRIKQGKEEDLKQRKKSQRKKSSRTALDIERIEAHQRKVAKIPVENPAPAQPLPKPAAATVNVSPIDRFGLNDIPKID
ncbi:hypothetical protein [Rugamonas aquatica]|uniref:Integrase catalytic domain-containing protein n=1 Tax=Rugamonas aquatica TaxID=2743357 RepID=A0A6A7MVJ6_9BURK|nr:hypothetical protein [Rugamonas aquatica]MQA37051.1 hypothetical protein [Rugamonas aquatica]